MGKRKLTLEQVQAMIAEAAATNGEGWQALAPKYGVATSTVYQILTRQTWYDVPRVWVMQEYSKREESNHHAILSREQVRAIRAQIARRRGGYRELGKVYGVAPSTIGNIAQGRSWPFVEPREE